MLRVSFKLDDADLKHFAEVAQQTQRLARSQPQGQIIAAAREVLDKAAQAQPARFMQERYDGLRTMLDMLADEDWRLAGEDLQRVLNALACFATSATSGSATELLDHAIMIELVSRDLQHDLEAYRDFCRSRSAHAQRHSSPAADSKQWLNQRRDSLQARMRQRRKRDLQAAGSAVRRLFSLFGL